MDASMMACLQALEEENRRLKKMVAEERLKAEMVQETLQKSGKAISVQRGVQASGTATLCQYSTGLLCRGYQRNRLSISAQAEQ